MTTLGSFYALAAAATPRNRRWAAGAAYRISEAVRSGESIASARTRLLTVPQYASGLTAAGLTSAFNSVDMVVGADLRTLPEPWHSGHRGGLGEALSPENTVASFQAGADADVPIMDGGDVRMISDGTLVCSHAATVDSTTSGTGTVASFTAATWDALVADVSAWSPPFSGWADTKLATFEQVLQIAATNGQMVITPENKDQGNQTTVQAMVDLIRAYDLQRAVLFMSFNDADFAIPRSAGIATGKISSGPGPSPATLKGLGVDYLLYDYTNTADFTPAYLQSVFDAGIRLSPWTLLRRTNWEREKARVGRSLAGTTCSDSQWLSRSAPYLTSDPYATQRWWPGAFSTNGFRPGVFRAGGKWGFNTNGSGLQGWGSRDTPNQQSIQFTLTLENNVATATRWVSLNFWATDDRFFGVGRGSGDDATGYKLLIRQDGVAQLYRSDPSTEVQLGSNLTTTALGPSVTSTWKVEDMGSNQIRVTRVDTAQSFTVTSGTYRGGYFSFSESDGAEGLQSSFSAVTTTG